VGSRKVRDSALLGVIGGKSPTHALRPPVVALRDRGRRALKDVDARDPLEAASV